VGLDESPSLLALKNQLVRWLCDAALPLWDRFGIDREGGGFFETLSFSASNARIEASGAIRRGRVVARQIYVFEIGQRFGWCPPSSDPVAHGCSFLLERLLKPNGLFDTSVAAARQVQADNFSLYEHAFYLFALARAHASRCSSAPLDRIARNCVQRLRDSFGKRMGGFEESEPPTLPLRSNPHMHLLEAALAWIAVSSDGEQEIWTGLAEELVSLCLERFLCTDSGGIVETFDADWRPLPEQGERLVIEPGHQFEWAWLLAQWSALEHCTVAQRAQCHAAVKQLTNLAETWGVDHARGVAMNELWSDLRVKDAAAKLWPQTERVKAWCAMLRLAASEGEASYACDRLIASIRGLTRYFLETPHGLWAEVLGADGQFLEEPCKASSFYHVVGAIEGLQVTLSALSETSRHHQRLMLETTQPMAFSS
jgi:mannose-6-phosphate isomerase